MTTLEPGASDVLTQGFRSRPFSTAFFANSAAPIMTDGLDVFVQDVIAAITTAPWSTTPLMPSAKVTSTGCDCRPSAAFAAVCVGAGADSWPVADVGSDAGNDSASASSWASWIESPST